MFKRGVQTLFLLLLMLFKSSYLLADDSITLTYTVAPSQSFLSGKLDRGSKYIGGYHSLIKELTKDMNITLKYIPYSDYNKAIQNTMIYNPSKTPEIILGNFFDEDKTPYLYYFDYPIYQDYMVFIANKEFLPKDFKPIKGDLENSIYSLLNSNIPYSPLGIFIDAFIPSGFFILKLITVGPVNALHSQSHLLEVASLAVKV